jgi:hypothetical protein
MAKADAHTIFGLTIMFCVIVLAIFVLAGTIVTIWRSWRPKEQEHEDISWDRRRPGR